LKFKQVQKFKETEIGRISEDFDIFTIKELKEKGYILEFQDGNHGNSYPRKKDFSNIGRSFLTANLIKNLQVNFEEAPKLPESLYAKLRIGFTQPGDVLLTHNATVGRVALLPEEAGNCIVGTSVTYYRLDPKKLDNNYFTYFLCSNYFQNQLEGIMSQTTRNQVPITTQAMLYVLIPSITTQKNIGKILSTLDNYINNFKNQNKILEQIIQSIFKSWFVDFDGVTEFED